MIFSFPDFHEQMMFNSLMDSTEREVGILFEFIKFYLKFITFILKILIYYFFTLAFQLQRLPFNTAFHHHLDWLQSTLV